MFILSELKDIIRIPPSLHLLPRNDALIDQINIKYANRILPSVGLCIRAFDIQETSEGTIFSCQDGSSTFTCYFRLVVFRPFEGEVLEGVVDGCNEEGVRVSLDFMMDVFIPAGWMKENCEYLKTEGVWVWNVDNGDEENDSDPQENMVQMYLDQGELIRCRVESIVFNEVGPSALPTPTPSTLSTLSSSTGAVSTSAMKAEDALQDSLVNVTKSSYYLLCSINDAGLGLNAWWE